MCAPSLNRFGSNSVPKKVFTFSFDIFWMAFVGKKMHIPLFARWVHRTQVMLSNFIKNPVCSFNNPSSNSKSPIRQKICVKSQNRLQKKFFSFFI